MKLETLFEKFDQFADAPDAVAKMWKQAFKRQRRSVIQPRVGATQELLPWDCRKKNINPNGVASVGARWMQPFQGCSICEHIPRVARASQPWAGRWNPVGIRETANHPSAPSDQPTA